jgi:hypothetical protein
MMNNFFDYGSKSCGSLVGIATEGSEFDCW